VFSSTSNPPPTFDCISAAAVLAVMINSLARWTQIGSMIVLTANLKVVTSCFLATELARSSHESKIASPCQSSKLNTLLLPRAPVKQRGISSSCEICTAKTHLCSRSIATLREHLVISRLGSQRLAQSILTSAITIVEISMPARELTPPTYT
jgi:hypothetical protein